MVAGTSVTACHDSPQLHSTAGHPGAARPDTAPQACAECRHKREEPGAKGPGGGQCEAGQCVVRCLRRQRATDVRGTVARSGTAEGDSRTGAVPSQTEDPANCCRVRRTSDECPSPKDDPL